MKAYNREKKENLIKIIGLHVEKYRLMSIVLCSIVSGIALFLSIYWNYDENSAGALNDNLYLVSHLFFLAISQVAIVMLILNKFNIVKTNVISIYFHIHAFFLMAWATLVCALDLDIGISPFIYLIASSCIAGLFVLEPIFYTVCSLMSFITIVIFSVINKSAFFQGDYAVENYSNLIIYVLITILIAFKNYRVTISEFKAKDKLETLTYYDELTGLLNERSYMKEVDRLTDLMNSSKPLEFAIVMMDVNNLKATNDAYGHRYGCSLVVRCGHTLPDIFKTSKLFHVGGDEFIAIVQGEDYQNFDSIMKEFEEKMTYSLVEYEGQELIFSVAHGYSKYEIGDKYQDTFKRADVAMYSNKVAIKTKYNMKGR